MKVKRLKKIQYHLQEELDKTIKSLLVNTEFTSEGIKGYIADVKRGFAHFNYQFTVPLWTYNKTGSEKYMKEEGYFIYYVAHELSHILSYKKHGPIKGKGHNKNFYEIFKIICPKEYQCFEIPYKPSAKKYINE